MEGTSGGEKEYLANIHSLRSKVLSVQTDIAECEKLYPVYTTEQGWTETEYQFTRCLEFLAEKNLKIISVDCEVRMLTLINDLRATGAEAELISFATQYWEKFHDVMQHINDIRNGYQSVVLSKLLLMFNNQMVFPTKTNTSLTAEYGRQVMQKMSTVEKLHHRLISQCQTYQTKVDKNLLEKVTQGQLLIMHLPRDSIVKLKILISLSNDLLNREEHFVTEIATVMTECRKRKVECEVALSEKRQLQLDKINSVYMATLLLQQNKEQVELLDQEMDELQTQLNNKENIIQSTEVEMEREQNAIDFLNHTISSTKRNQRLLVKRQHLLKTRKSLEKKLEQIKSELQTVNEELQQKTLKKVEMRKRLEQNTTSHSTITADLNSFTNSLEEIEKEAKSVHTELIDIEIIHCIKTSPENLDDMQDRPQSVKIARSLRDTIYRKRSQQPKLL